jgi:hypothetical protein
MISQKISVLMAVKTQLTELFFKGKVLIYFVLQSEVKQHATRMKEG